MPIMSDPYSHRAVWRIAAPMMVSSISVPLLGIVDTAVMGHLVDPVFLAAVAAGSIIFTTVFMGMNFLRMGTTGIAAQAFGAGDFRGLRESLTQATLVALVLSTLFILLRKPILDLALVLLAPSAGVANLAREYYSIRIFSAPASLCNFVLIGWLLGMQNARGPLAIMLTINLTNIVLDLLLVVYLGMNVDGVALASLIAEAAGLIVGIAFVRNELRKYPGDWPTKAVFKLGRYRRLFAVNASLLLRTLSLMFVFAFITARGARMGDLILAVNAVLLNFQFFLSYALDGIAHAAEALAGKAIGARDRRGLHSAINRTLQWSLLFAAAFSVAYMLIGQQLIYLLTDIEKIRSVAIQYLPWLIVSPIVSVWSFLYDGIYVGATRTKEMLLVMAGSAFLVFIPAWYLTTAWGNHGLWFAFTCFMAARGIGMHLWLRTLLRTQALVPAHGEMNG